MKVKLKKLNENAQLPIKGKEGDFCYDVYAVSEEEVAPNVWKYKLGFKYEIDRLNFQKMEFVMEQETEDKTGLRCVHYPTDFLVDIELRARSGIWKTGMVLANSIGTLDEFYRGEAMAVFYHVMPDMPRYKVGDRVGQITLGFTLPIEFEWADEINENTERGEGGFNSTGLR